MEGDNVIAASVQQDGPEQSTNHGEELATAKTQGAGEETNPQPNANEGEDEQHGEKRLSGYERVKRQRDEERREKEYWRTEAMKHQKPPDPKADEPAKNSEPRIPVAMGDDPNDPMPTMEQFDNDPDPYVSWQKALALWGGRQAYRQAKETEKAESEAAKQKSEQQTIRERFDQKMVEARKVHADFDDVVMNPKIPITTAMGEVIMRSELGAEVAYFLGNNPAEASRIAGLSSSNAQAWEIGKIEARLAGSESAVKEEAKTPPEPPVTKAPAPPRPVGKTGAVAKPFDANDEATAKSMSADEWAKQRTAELRKKGAL